MKKLSLILANFVTMLIGTSCIQVDYIGQKLTPLPEGSAVVCYNNLKSVPDDMKPIGRGHAMFPMVYLYEDIEEVFANKAIEIGASAFAISSTEQVMVGVTEEVQTYPTRPDGNWNVDSTDMTGRMIYTDTFGNEEGLGVVRTERYKLRVNVVYYVTIETYNTLLDRTPEAIRKVVEKQDIKEEIIASEADDLKEAKENKETKVEESTAKLIDSTTGEEIKDVK